MVRSELDVLGLHKVVLFESEDLVFHARERLPFHANGMRFVAFDPEGRVLCERIYYSVGGGFVVGETEAGADRNGQDKTALPYPFESAEGLLTHCSRA